MPTQSRLRSHTAYPSAQLAISTTTLPNGTVGSAYSATLAASGARPAVYLDRPTDCPRGESQRPDRQPRRHSHGRGQLYHLSHRHRQRRVARVQVISRFGRDREAPGVVTNSLPGGKANPGVFRHSLNDRRRSALHLVDQFRLPAGGFEDFDGAAGSISGTPTTAGTELHSAQVTDSGSRTATTASLDHGRRGHRAPGDRQHPRAASTGSAYSES